ncbi:MAG: hypothetical protein HYV09_36280 [Deltaproteobacteria bacterium]|nr:hypothetical protein [Deltaproteobacteria bacterium]
MSDDPESALVAELRGLAGPTAANADSFVIARAHLRIDVIYTGGSSSSVTLKATYDHVAKPVSPAEGYRDVGLLRAPRPMHITLRPEDAGDVAAKRERLSVEWQTGDEEFDRRVYVDSDTTDRAVLSAVLNAEVRAATLALMDLGFKTVIIDDGGQVIARVVEFVQRVPRANRGRLAVDAFARLLGNLPAVTHVETARPAVPLLGWTRLLGAIGAIGWGLNVGYVGLVLMAFHAVSGRASREPEPPGTLATIAVIAVAIVAGVIAAKVYGSLVRERVRGRSNAHQLAFTATLCAFGGASVLTFTAMFVAVMALAGR